MTEKFTKKEISLLKKIVADVKCYGVQDEHLGIISWDAIPVTAEQIERLTGTAIAHWKSIVAIYSPA